MATVPEQVEGSLTKEFPLREVDATIAMVRPGMSYDELRRLARERTNAAIPALLRNRFLLVQGDRIIGDRLLSLIEAEGLGTPRIRKIMYLTWALRDSRLRRFILERIADNNGRWRVAELTRKSNASFFEEFFAPGPTTKVRSNIEYFFAEAGIYDSNRGTINLDLADGWLPDGVQVASQHVADVAQRRAMVNGPVEFLISRGWHGLANATPDELRGIETRVEFDDEAADDTELAVTYPPPQRQKRWQRQAPQMTARQQTTAQIDLVARERATMAHFRLEQLMATAATGLGHEPCYNEHIDLFFHTQHGTVLMEMKSCRETNLHAQVRKGVSQLLEYEYLYNELLRQAVTKVLVLQRRPNGAQWWLLSYLQRLGIFLAWRSLEAERLESTMPIPPALEGLVTRTQ